MTIPLDDDGLVERLRSRTQSGKWSDTLVADPDCTAAATLADKRIRANKEANDAG